VIGAKQRRLAGWLLSPLVLPAHKPIFKLELACRARCVVPKTFRRGYRTTPALPSIVATRISKHVYRGTYLFPKLPDDVGVGTPTSYISYAAISRNVKRYTKGRDKVLPDWDSRHIT
jgi:hypothetical protein